jgi:hypothetical protein
MTKTLQELELELQKLDYNDVNLYDTIHEYEENYNSPRLDLLKSILFKTKNSFLASGAINIIADHSDQDDVFWDYIIEVAEGAEWDEDEYARLSAINAIRFYTGNEIRLTGLVLSGIKADNPIVRDAIATLAQYKIGLSSVNVDWGKGEGVLLSRIPQKAKDWIETFKLQ